MNEARDIFERFKVALLETQSDLIEAGEQDAAAIFGEIAEDAQKALAAPPPDAVPELPEWMTQTVSGHWHVLLSDGSYYWMHDDATSADLDRIAEACRILAARRRAP